MTAFDCEACGAAWEMIGVCIRGGRLHAGLVFAPGDCVARFGREPHELVIVQLGADDEPTVRDDWFDPPFTVQR